MSAPVSPSGVEQIDSPVIVETRPTAVPPGKAKKGEPYPWEDPTWQAHREKVLAMKLHGEFKAFVAAGDALIGEACRLAAELEECPEGESPFSVAPGYPEENDLTGEVASDLFAFARVLNTMLAFIRCEL